MRRNKIQLSTSSQKCLTLQTIDDAEFYDWLYAISPLLVGQLRSVGRVVLDELVDSSILQRDAKTGNFLNVICQLHIVRR